MKNSQITAKSIDVLKVDFTMYMAAINKLVRAVEKAGFGSWYGFLSRYNNNGEVDRGYDLMMNRTQGVFSAKEWLNCIVA